MVITFVGRVVGHFSWQTGGWSLSLATEWLVIFLGRRVVGHFPWRPSGWSFTFGGRVVGHFFGERMVGHFLYWLPSGWSLSLAAECLVTFFGDRVVDHFLMMAKRLSLLAGRVLIFLMTAEYLVSKRSWCEHALEFKSSNIGLGPLYFDLSCHFCTQGVVLTL